MNLETYVPLALRTEKRLPTPIDRLHHATLGLITETGEFATPIKRVAIYGKDLDSVDEKDSKRRTLRQQACEELGDAMWYLAIAISALGADAAYVEMNAYTAALPPIPLEDLALDLGAEVGRLASVTLFCKRRGTITAGDRGLLTNSLSSVLRLARAACAPANLDMDMAQLMQDNVDKLRARFPDAYSDEAAEARADKGGLGATES